MLEPRVFAENLFDDWMNYFPWMKEMNQIDHKLYGKHANREMLMDVKEHDDHYEVEIDLPGFKKEDLTIKLENGYLTVTAAKGLNEEEKNKEGKLIRQERYSGTMSRSFWVGSEITSQQISAKFEDGVLHLGLPKQTQQLENKNIISIE